MKYHVIGGGTVVHVRPHFALTAPAYGKVARDLLVLLEGEDSTLHLSRMAGGSAFETNTELKALLEEICSRPERCVIFMSAAVCDFEPGDEFSAGKASPRLKTAEEVMDIPAIDVETVQNEPKRERVSLVGDAPAEPPPLDDVALQQ